MGNFDFITSHDTNDDGTPDLFVVHNHRKAHNDLMEFTHEFAKSKWETNLLLLLVMIATLTPGGIVIYMAAYQPEQLQAFLRSMGWM